MRRMRASTTSLQQIKTAPHDLLGTVREILSKRALVPSSVELLRSAQAIFHFRRRMAQFSLTAYEFSLSVVGLHRHNTLSFLPP